MKIIDIENTPEKEILKEIQKYVEIKKYKGSLVKPPGSMVRLIFYVNPKTNPMYISVIRDMGDPSDYNSDYTTKEIAAYLCLEQIRELMENTKVKLPAKTTYVDFEESEDGKTFMPITETVYCNVKIRDKNLIGLKLNRGK